MVREEPYPDLTCEWYRSESGGTRKGAHTGVARLSSARVVRCWVKSRNERNLRGLLYLSDPTADRHCEVGGDEVMSAWPLCLGLDAGKNRRSQCVVTKHREA